MSGDILGCHHWGLLLASSGKRPVVRLNIPQGTGQHSPTRAPIKNYPSQNVSSAKRWGIWLQSRGVGRGLDHLVILKDLWGWSGGKFLSDENYLQTEIKIFVLFTLILFSVQWSFPEAIECVMTSPLSWVWCVLVPFLVLISSTASSNGYKSHKQSPLRSSVDKRVKGPWCQKGI